MSKIKRKYIERAKIILKNHKYKKLFSNENTEIWSCEDPEYSNDNFVISVTQFGTSVIGPKINYIFNSKDKIENLISKEEEIEETILEKLNYVYKDKSFDKGSFLQSIMVEVLGLFYINENFSKNINNNKFLNEIDTDCFLLNEIQILNKFDEFYGILFRTDFLKDNDFKTNLNLAIKEALHIENAIEAEIFVRKNNMLQEGKFNKFCYRETGKETIQDLYIIKGAVLKIIELKNQNLHLN